jgi:peptidoglycan/LPS O-acetylase OafA/YrhL
MTTTQIDRSGFRADIQGLRTIGAFLVTFFHILINRISGGVDVFFVLSGYLITGSLLREVERTGRIDVVGFWGRIATRLAPSGYVVIALTLAASLLWMPRTRWEGFLSEVFYSTLHLENIKLMMIAADYLARTEAPSPLQQFWALSVQVQFYAVWPFVLLCASILARKAASRSTAYTAVIAAILVASFIYSVHATIADPKAAYFDPIARTWEFALGAVLVVADSRLTLPPAMRIPAGWAGLFLVVGCGFIISNSFHFPGYVALWPTLGAVLILLSGGENSRFGVSRLLGAKPLVALGDFSFTFYLWHWPVLVFYLLMINKTQAGIRGGLGVIVVSLAGAYLTARIVEQPSMVRFRQGRRPWVPHAAATAFAVPVLAVALASWAALDKDEPEGAGGVANGGAVVVDGIEYPGAANEVSSEVAFDPSLPIYPPPLLAKRMPKAYRAGCHQKSDLPEVRTCLYGAESNPTKVVALVGGSHSVHWLPAFKVLAARFGWQVVNITKSACPFEVNAFRRPSCVQWNEDVHAVLRKIKPDVVFTTSTRSDRWSRKLADAERGQKSDNIEIVPRGYLLQWKRLAENGISVIAVRDNPRFAFDVPECIERSMPDLLKCARPRRQKMNAVDPASELNPKPDNVSFIDLTDRFCDAATCYPVNGNILMYRDSHHISTTYARSLAGVLGERMKQVRPDLFDGFSSPQRQAMAQ